jgi:hypothetical protein
VVEATAKPRRGLNALIPIRNAARSRLVLRTHLIGEVVFIAPIADLSALCL